MDEKRINARFNELDTEICAVQDIAFNAHWPSVAIALALIDKGLIEKETLRAITVLLRDYVSSNSEPGTSDDTARALDELLHWLSMPFRQNTVVAALEHLERVTIEDIFRRRVQKTPQKPE